MPASYRIDQHHRLVYSRAWGVVSEAELIAHAQTLRSDSSFNPEFRQIIDFTSAERLPISYTAMRGLSRMVPFALSARRVAVIQRDLYYGLFRMYEILLGSVEGRLSAVRTLDAALLALDVPIDQADAVTGSPDRIFNGGTPS